MEMSNAEIRDYQARARSYAAAHGERDNADDFAQEAVIKVIHDQRELDIFLATRENGKKTAKTRK